MRNLKNKIAFIVLSLAVSFSFSQTTDFDRISTFLTGHSVTEGKFVQKKVSSALKKPVVSSGRYIISNLGILWDTEKPFASKTAVTKTLMIQTLPSGKKYIVDGSSNEVFMTVSESLSSLFSGNKTELEKSFEILSFTSKSGKWNLELKPRDTTIAEVLRKIELEGVFDSSDASLTFMKILQGQTDFTTYEFTAQTYRQELSDEEKKLFTE